MIRVGQRRMYSNAGIEAAAEELALGAGMPFADYLREAVFEPLGMSHAVLRGSPAHGVHADLNDIVRFVGEMLHPRLLAPDTYAEVVSTQYPSLAGIVPEVGRFDPCPWGLGVEVRGDKAPHWTGRANSPATFGHFGGSGTMMWVDPGDRPSASSPSPTGTSWSGSPRRWNAGRSSPTPWSRSGSGAADVPGRRSRPVGDHRRRRPATRPLRLRRRLQRRPVAGGRDARRRPRRRHRGRLQPARTGHHHHRRAAPRRYRPARRSVTSPRPREPVGRRGRSGRARDPLAQLPRHGRRDSSGFVLAELWAGNEQYVLRASADTTSNTIRIKADDPHRWEI